MLCVMISEIKTWLPQVTENGLLYKQPLIEKWKMILDNKGYGCAILMDLFKDISYNKLLTNDMPTDPVKTH